MFWFKGKHYWKSMIPVFKPKYVRYEISVEMQNRFLKLKFAAVFPFRDIWENINYFNRVSY